MQVKSPFSGICLDTSVNYFTKTMYMPQDQVICGYASVFDVCDTQKDIIKRGAFADMLSNSERCRKLPLLWQHQADNPIGRIESLIEDEYGLYIKARILSGVSKGMEAIHLIKSQSVCHFSIGYNPLRYYLDYEQDARVLEVVDLWEISVVTFPANNQSCITAIY